jgi:nucleotide-binding universal stress UspA family protein
MFSSILVPLAPDHQAVAGTAMAAARALLAPGGRITVLSVIEAIPSYVMQYLPADQAERNRADVEASLAAEFAGQSDVSAQVAVGHAANMILDVTTTGNHDCIVISSHRPGLADYLLGSTAARVVRHAQVAVLVLR